MRAMIEGDRQVEGCFTAYNTALERSVLKKDLFLNPPQASPETTAPETAPKAPSAAPPAPVPAHNGTAKSDSLFADKLKLALQPASAAEGK